MIEWDHDRPSVSKMSDLRGPIDLSPLLQAETQGSPRDTQGLVSQDYFFIRGPPKPCPREHISHVQLTFSTHGLLLP